MAKTSHKKAAYRAPSRIDFEALAAFRHAMRRFLVFSDQSAEEYGLTPNQHQALLSIKAGYFGRESISIGELAEHLMIKHHSAVELVDRLETARLVNRRKSQEDGRVVLLSLSSKGEQILAELSRRNLDELRLAAPFVTALVVTLEHATGKKLSRNKRSTMAALAGLSGAEDDA
jgi:DNA-binding MarR family transcriptional regulator